MDARITVPDQLDRIVELVEPANRIISLVPSITEMLYSFDIHPIAQTTFCVHPRENFKTSKKIGGTKKLKIDKIMDLEPDLILANKEENLQSDIEELSKHFPVYVSDISNLDEMNRMVRDIGMLAGCEKPAEALVTKVEQKRSEIMTDETSSYIYLIWQKPFFAVGTDTFIHHMLSLFQFENAMDKMRYFELSLSEIKDANPEYLFLSSEPFPFKQKHLVELQEQLPEIKVRLIDGEMTSWYGSRVPMGLDYLRRFRLNELR